MINAETDNLNARRKKLVFKVSLFSIGYIKNNIVIGYLSDTSLSLGTRLAAARHICLEKNLSISDEELIALLFEFGMLTTDEYEACRMVGAENFMQYASSEYIPIKTEELSLDEEKAYYEKIKQDAAERSNRDAKLGKYPVISALRAEATLAKKKFNARQKTAECELAPLVAKDDAIKRAQIEKIAKAREWLVRSNALRNSPQ